MSYIHLSLAGVPAIIQQANTLTNEKIGKPFYTPVFLIEGWVQRLMLEQKIAMVKQALSDDTQETKEVAKANDTQAVPIQLTLF